MRYRGYGVRRQKQRRSKKWVFILLFIVAVAAAIYFLMPSKAERSIQQISFDSSVTESEKETIKKAIADQKISVNDPVTVSVKTTLETETPDAVLSVFVPATNVYSTDQSTSTAQLGDAELSVKGMDAAVKPAVAETLNINAENLVDTDAAPKDYADDSVVLVPADQLDYQSKLLALNDNYYLDGFKKGAVFRVAEFSGTDSLKTIKLNNLPNKESVLKVNMTGVTALTRIMIRKLNSVGGPTYFSEKIGGFLADADITHVSNEVSFKSDCSYSDTVFCSPPEFIETLKASGVDLVELTGNHNNDVGSEYNTETINLYKSLGWNTVGGGLNTDEAAKPYTTDQKGSKIAFLGYNYPDSPNGGAIAGSEKAGANSFDFDKIESDIKTAKQNGQFVVVDVQFWECYAYPDGYVEYPICDYPIDNQSEVFRKIVDLGADMVVGTQAHQPQTYEIYKDKPIYYGLGNLYFEQTQWPGTERGIILTNYYSGSKLIQTKLSPTVYDKDLQTRLMTEDEAESLLERLKDARNF